MGNRLMECGHVENSLSFPNLEPNCCICMVDKVNKDEIDLTGRMALCVYGCGRTQLSSLDLRGFQFRKDSKNDTFYCGCFGNE